MKSTFLKSKINRVSRVTAPYLTKLFVNTTLSRRQKIDALLKTFNPAAADAEKRALSRIQNFTSAFDINRDLGFGQISLDPALVAACVDDTKLRFENLRSSTQNNTKEYLRVFSNLSDYDSSSAVFRLATSENLIKPIADYLDSAPVLWTIAAMYSPPPPQSCAREHDARQWKGSQFWHRDGEDVASIKVWVLCSDVKAENGPTVCLPRKTSDALAKRIGYKQGEKVTADEILDPYNAEFISLTGKTGATFATDTCRCFHMGSRTNDERGRLVLSFNYLTRRSQRFWPIVSSLSERQINANIGNLNQLQKDLLYPFFE